MVRTPTYQRPILVTSIQNQEHMQYFSWFCKQQQPKIKEPMLDYIFWKGDGHRSSCASHTIGISQAKNASWFFSPLSGFWQWMLSACRRPTEIRAKTSTVKCQSERAGPFVMFPVRLGKVRFIETSDLSVIITPLLPHRPKPSGGEWGWRLAPRCILFSLIIDMWSLN